MAYYGYIRVSTKGQVPGTSLAEQEQQIKERYPTATMAIKACLPLVRVVAHKPLHLFPGVVVVARLSPIEEKRHGAPAVWLNAKRTYPICPILRRRYLASLSLSKSK